MNLHQRRGLRYLTFSSLEPYPVFQAVVGRQGGHSPPPWNSLNLGGTVGDDPDRVAQNKQKLLDVFGLRSEDLYEVWQVHSAKVIRVSGREQKKKQLHQADAVITDQPGTILLMRFADCVPILLYDPEHHVLGMAHAGWQGTVRHVARNTVQALSRAYGTAPEAVRAGIGPSIGPDHYQVGEDVIVRVKEAYPDTYRQMIVEEEGLVKLDLWQANRLDLEQAGISSIENPRICTACHNEAWYSHRAENGRTGRFGALFGLEKRIKNDR